LQELPASKARVHGQQLGGGQVIAEMEEVGQLGLVTCSPSGVGGSSRDRHLSVSRLQRAAQSELFGLVKKADLRAPVYFRPVDAPNWVLGQHTVRIPAILTGYSART
jgi:hypothetical protein